MISGAKSSGHRLTLSQQTVVFTNDTNLLVGAGAGSGKTSTIVQKLCYLVGGNVQDAEGNERRIENPIGLDTVAAITYTNQAAADLKRKLRSALRGAGKPRLAGEVDVARIGTIHSFCADILRDFSLRAGLSPSANVLSPRESSLRRMDCARAVLSEAADNDVEALLQLAGGRRLRDISSWIEDLASSPDRLAGWVSSGVELRPDERTLLKLATKAAVMHRDELTRSSTLDFDLMITATRDLLRDDDDVRRAVQREIRILVIDEFQDVDPAQRDIALSLAGISGDDDSPSRLVLVGDPKQSIYRFRGAEVSLWNDISTRFDAQQLGMRVELTDNFRSKRGILALVDLLVGSRLDQAIVEGDARKPYEVDHAPLVASNVDADGDNCVELLCIAPRADGKQLATKQVRIIEAQAIAERIRELHETGTRYGDIALLLRSWKDLDIYRHALRLLDIPVYAFGTSGFWNAREVTDCLLTLRAIRDPFDNTALVGFLKSPFVGVRDETLVALANSAHGGCLFGALLSEPRERSLLHRANELLSRFGVLRDRLPVHTIIARLILESGFLASSALDSENGSQAVLNLRKLVRLASAQPERSLGEFLRMSQLEQSAGNSASTGEEEGEAQLFAELADVVSITSVHGAKGLEWPVVFWCDLVRDLKKTNSELITGRDCFRLRAVGATTWEQEEDSDDPEHESLCAEEDLENWAEQFRLWYVASTRPAKLLVLSGVPLGTGKPNRSMASRVRGVFSAQLLVDSAPRSIRYSHSMNLDSDEVFCMSVRVANSEAASGTPRDVVLSSVDLVIARERVTVPCGRSRLSATQLAVFASDPSIWWARYILGYDSTLIESATWIRDIGVRINTGKSEPLRAEPIAFGLDVHEFLKRFEYDLEDVAELASHFPSLVGMPIDRGGDVDQYHAKVRAMAEKVLRSPAWSEVARSSGARRELQFTRILADGTVLDGAFDLAGVADGEVKILDAKVSSADREMLMARYTVQAQVYAEVASALTDKPATVALVSTGLRKPVAMTLSGSETIEDRVATVREFCRHPLR